MLTPSVLISTGIMTNGTVLDATEAYNRERTSSEDIYPLSFQVGFHHSSWNLLPSTSLFVGRCVSCHTVSGIYMAACLMPRLWLDQP